jgi:hypothetical protein
VSRSSRPGRRHRSPGEVDAIEKVSGTFGLSGAADTILILDRGSNGATLYGRGRDIEESRRPLSSTRTPADGACWARRWRSIARTSGKLSGMP